MITITIICFRITVFQNIHIRKTDNTKAIAKLTVPVLATPSTAHNFVTVINAYETTKQVVKYLGIPGEEYSQTFQSRLAGDKWLSLY
jgi:ferrochelatase